MLKEYNSPSFQYIIDEGVNEYLDKYGNDGWIINYEVKLLEIERYIKG